MAYYDNETFALSFSCYHMEGPLFVVHTVFLLGFLLQFCTCCIVFFMK